MRGLRWKERRRKKKLRGLRREGKKYEGGERGEGEGRGGV